MKIEISFTREVSSRKKKLGKRNVNIILRYKSTKILQFFIFIYATSTIRPRLLFNWSKLQRTKQKISSWSVKLV